jgi:hypothetical protein
LIFNVDDERDDVLDVADIDDGDNVDKKFVNKREDNGDDSDTHKIALMDGFGIFAMLRC